VVLPDVNVLVYAFRLDVPDHAVAHRWLRTVLSSNALFGLSPLVLSAVVRVTTNPRAFGQPSVREEAFEFCDYLLNQAHCQLVEPGRRHWDIFKALCNETDTRARRVTDAWFAALAIESGCEWITFDRDFARFPGLHWRRPAIPQ
jgi:toxin-antitoxin system PIN domain toxin